MKRLAIFLLLALAAPVSADDAVAPKESKKVPPVPWRELEYLASKFGLEARSSLSRQPPDAQGRSRIELTSTAAGRSVQEAVDFDAATGAVLERTKDRLGRKSYSKVYRFDKNGVKITRSAPKDDSEAKLGREKWTLIELSSFARPAATADCAAISEPTLLFHLFEAHPWSSRPKLSLCVFSGKHWSRLEAERLGEESFKPPEVGVDVSGPFHKIKVRALPLDAAGADDELELLGLKGDLEILLDGRGIPIRLKGTIDWIGEIEVFLVRLALADGGA